MVEIKKGYFKEQRDELLEEIKNSSVGIEALKKLKTLREEFDLVNEDYSNVLKLLSENVYQDSTHFILELIQNADDAQFLQQEAKIKFIIKEDCIELKYNEKGFDVEDVIAITGAATSTKIRKEDSHRFIGEKGIGFKSVFAMASDVEIESPPWHFQLRKDRCIVPEIIDSKEHNIEGGTRLRVNFTNSKDLKKVTDKLFDFFGESSESFLFLQRLSDFTLEDCRGKNKKIKQLKIQPTDRNNSKLTLYKYPENIRRDYLVYSQEVDFSANLVSERWERLNEPLKRKLILVVPIIEPTKQIKNGRLFCFLPTKVTLPIPVFLQVDGKTKADREGLYDPEKNKWNSYLFKILPNFLYRALLSLRRDQNVSRNLPDYIPSTGGTEQLAPVFEELILLLKSKPWVKTFGEKDNWTTPENVIILDDLLEYIFKKYPRLRIKAEKVSGKKFVHPEWTCRNEWVQKFTNYGIKRINQDEAAKILANIEIPGTFLKHDQNLIRLYKYISDFNFENESKRGYLYDFDNEWPSVEYNEELRNTLLHAPIYPLEDGSFGPLLTETESANIFWISSRSKSKTGLDETLDFCIVNPKFTYITETRGSASSNAQEKVEEINLRNEYVRELLKKLKIKELNDENLLRELQIPYLLNCDKKNYNLNARFAILNAVYEVYIKKKCNDEFLQDISKLSDSLFPDKEGNLHKLKELILPLPLHLHPVDKLYVSAGLEALAIPDNFLKTEKSGTKKISDSKERERQFKKLEDWRQFLIFSGIKSEPVFCSNDIKYYNSSGDFSYKDEIRFSIWKEAINNDYTENNPVTIKIQKLDSHTLYLIRSNTEDRKLLAEILYSKWISAFGNKIKNNNLYDPLFPGYFEAKYQRHSYKSKIMMDYLWAGEERKNIPLISVSGNLTNPEDALRITTSQKKMLGVSFDYFSFVEESEGDYSDSNKQAPRYHSKYLDSLEIISPKIDDFNALWAKLDLQNDKRIVEVALEFFDMGVDPQFLKLYNFNSKKLIPAKDFCLGETGPNGAPLIEEQYGSVGKKLGLVLGLKNASGSEAYEDVFDLIIDKKKKKTFEKRLYYLFKDWHGWDKQNRAKIKKRFDEIIVNYKLETPILVVNNSEIVDCLRKENKLLAFGILSGADEKYAIEKAAKSVGFKLLDDVKSDTIPLETDNESKLNDAEIKELDRVFNIYCKNLDDKEKAQLQLELNEVLRIDPWIDKIVRVNNLYKTFGNNKIKKNQELPYFDESKKLIFVQHGNFKEILAHILVYCNFERKLKSALREINELMESKKFSDYASDAKVVEYNRPSRNIEEHVASNVGQITSDINSVEVPYAESVITLTGETKKSPNTKTDNTLFASKKIEGSSKEEAAQEYLENISKTVIGINGKKAEEWKVGLNPEKQNDLLKKMSEKFTISLLESPEIHKKKIRSKCKSGKINLSPDEKLVVPNVQDPNEFLRNEYHGRCQVCGNILRLVNGDNLVKLFRIVESKEGIWWYDYPFNVLSMCPNCHGLAKNGGYDFTDLFHIAQELSQDSIFTIEVPEFNGDFYEAHVKINGENKRLIMSPIHLINVASLFEDVHE
jgi:hypothetical protein